VVSAKHPAYVCVSLHHAVRTITMGVKQLLIIRKYLEAECPRMTACLIVYVMVM
jgi:hypothetical protein